MTGGIGDAGVEPVAEATLHSETPQEDAVDGYRATRSPPGEPRRVRVLVVPARVTLPCRLVLLVNRSVDFSDAIGGVLLDEVYPLSGDEQRRWCLYLGENRVREPINARLCALAEELGWQSPLRAGLRGDALITGLQSSGNDEDIPWATVRIARRIGLLAEESAPHRPEAFGEP